MCEGLLEAAYAFEAKSEHPISKAIVEYVEKKQIKLSDTTDFEIKAGNGLHAKLNGTNVYGGNTLYYIEENSAVLPSQVRVQIEALSFQGKTPVLFARDDKLLGIIAVADTIKEDSVQAIRELKNIGIHTCLFLILYISSFSTSEKMKIGQYVLFKRSFKKETVF